MKDISLSDRYASETIRMCERHFKQYRKHFDAAVRGGTTYSFSTTTKRGCIMCSRKRTGASAWCGSMWIVYKAMSLPGER